MTGDDSGERLPSRCVSREELCDGTYLETLEVVVPTLTNSGSCSCQSIGCSVCGNIANAKSWRSIEVNSLTPVFVLQFCALQAEASERSYWCNNDAMHCDGNPVSMVRKIYRERNKPNQHGQ
jgi:hypothetical protein